MCLCVLVCVNFEDEILLRGEQRKTRKEFNFFENKTVISVENWKFSISQMMKRTSPLNLSCEI